jgi:hypothetical protein
MADEPTPAAAQPQPAPENKGDATPGADAPPSPANEAPGDPSVTEAPPIDPPASEQPQWTDAEQQNMVPPAYDPRPTPYVDPPGTTQLQRPVVPAGAPNPADAAFFVQVGEIVVAAIRTFENRAQSEDQDKRDERAHELALIKARAQADKELIEAKRDDMVKRENTIRAFGGLSVIGIFTVLVAAVIQGSIKDPVAALPTLATVVSMLYLLVKRDISDQPKRSDNKKPDP